MFTSHTAAPEKESSGGFRLSSASFCWESGFEKIHAASQLGSEGVTALKSKEKKRFVLYCDLKEGKTRILLRATGAMMVSSYIKLSLHVHTHISVRKRDFGPLVAKIQPACSRTVRPQWKGSEE